MPEREAQMGDAGLEVVAETLHHRRQLPLVRLHEVIAQRLLMARGPFGVLDVTKLPKGQESLAQAMNEELADAAVYEAWAALRDARATQDFSDLANDDSEPGRTP